MPGSQGAIFGGGVSTGGARALRRTLMARHPASHNAHHGWRRIHGSPEVSFSASRLLVPANLLGRACQSRPGQLPFSRLGLGQNAPGGSDPFANTWNRIAVPALSNRQPLESLGWDGAGMAGGRDKPRRILLAPRNSHKPLRQALKETQPCCGRWELVAA
jgi:hypothetical protein